jgi:hypothetical protein
VPVRARAVVLDEPVIRPLNVGLLTISTVRLSVLLAVVVKLPLEPARMETVEPLVTAWLVPAEPAKVNKVPLMSEALRALLTKAEPL